MEQQPPQEQACPIPSEIDLSWSESSLYQHLVNSDWLAHFYLIFSVVLLLRAIWFFDVSTRLHRTLRLLATMATASGRANRRRRRQLAEEVKEMRACLRCLNMTDNFAAYSKLERRIKAACAELEKASTGAIPGRIALNGGIRVALLVLELVMQSWLVTRSPPELFPPVATLSASPATCPQPESGLISTWVPRFLLVLLHWVPTQCYSLLLILLCRQCLVPRLLQLLLTVSGYREEAESDGDQPPTDPLAAFVSG